MSRHQRLGLLTVLLIVGLFLAYAWTGWSDSSAGLAVLLVLIGIIAVSSIALALAWRRSDSVSA